MAEKLSITLKTGRDLVWSWSHKRVCDGVLNSCLRGNRCCWENFALQQKIHNEAHPFSSIQEFLFIPVVVVVPTEWLCAHSNLRRIRQMNVQDRSLGIAFYFWQVVNVIAIILSRYATDELIFLERRKLRSQNRSIGHGACEFVSIPLEKLWSDKNQPFKRKDRMIRSIITVRWELTKNSTWPGEVR